MFNIIFVVAGALGGWWMKVVWEILNGLQKTDKELGAEIRDLSVLVAGEYVKQETFDRTIMELFRKLDRIEGKIDKKEDKRNGQSQT